MKSSPKPGDMPPSTGSKTPASGKKLVQARLPFKTLGASEPPLTTATNDASNATLTSANTLTPVTDNRKRKQDTTSSKDDGIRAPKLNRCEYESSDDINLQTSEAMELSSDVLVGDVTAADAKLMLNRSSESKENVCVDEDVADKASLVDNRNEPVEIVECAKSTSKAKQSLDFEEKKPEQRKSKRVNDSSLIKIKLPMTKKAKKSKKHKKSTPSPDAPSPDAPNDEVQMVEETPDDTNMNVDEQADNMNTSLANESVMVSDNDDNDDDDDDVDDVDENHKESDPNQSCTLNDSILSNVSEQSLTPAKHPLTPKQMQRRIESEKKKQEKERSKLERERKLQEEKELRQREKEDREQQKKREREEKDEQRKKEKEMREQKMQEEKMEKQREKELKEQQRKMEKEEKEEQKKREREERDLQKKKEREEKEREKEEERKKREEEKRQKIEAEQNKNRKTVEAFVKFFVPKKVDSKADSNDYDEKMDVEQVPQTFMSFQVKDDMKMAPVTRRHLSREERSNFDHLISSDNPSNELYLAKIRNNTFVPRKTGRTWQDDDDEKCSNDDLFVIEEDGQNVQVLEDEPKKLYRAKFLKFSENRRPPYYGTWRKKSKTILPRKPLGLDSQMDYEVDSDDEWEEEEPGESLHGSDDEKEVESEDEYEIDNELFVPHGHLSDEELQDEDESDFNDPENMKFKLKLAQNEFEDERKKKTQKLKPRLIGLIWQNSDGTKPDNCSNGVWELMNKHAMLFLGPTVKVEKPTTQPDNSDDENSNDKKSLGVRRLQIGEKEIPDLIRLINGNQNNSKFLVKEFGAYLAKNHQPQREYSGVSIKAKIKELAIWQACPEEGRMFRKMCWYVPIATRKRYNLNDLTFPNSWSYIIPPRRPVEMVAEVENDDAKAEAEKKAEQPEVIALSDDSNSCSLSETLTPELIKRTAEKRSNYNIAKFIRPLTEDEKKKQFEPITLHRRPSDDQTLERQSNEFTSALQQTAGDKSNTVRAKKRASSTSSESSAPKKRINLLMSGPVGQEFSPKLKSTLVTQFLSTNLRKRKSTDVNNEVNDATSSSTAGTSDGAKKTKLNDSVIVID